LYFYDTCALLDNYIAAFDEEFAICSLTLQELEGIKTSRFKDDTIKFKTRKVLKKLNENEDKIMIIDCVKSKDEGYTNDEIIAETAACLATDIPDLIFYTTDYYCKLYASRILGLNVYYPIEDKENYTGFIEKVMTEEELANFYTDFADRTINPYNLLPNQYLILKSPEGEILDKFRYTEKGLVGVNYPCFKTDQFGVIKPKDIYQQIAMDSLINNQITMLRGPGGSGKSCLALAALFQALEKHQIDRIIFFCNTVATLGSAKLGYYPGSRNDKLLDSQIGNFLNSKLGDQYIVEQLVSQNKLILLPMSDIRGYDTSGMHAGIYITEAQNMSVEMMKLALQRIGEDSICIIDGDDESQLDMSMYVGNNNGMKRLSEVFRGSDIYGEIALQAVERSEIAKLANLM
jgi:predicted ribonuclease YlaK